MIIGVECVRLFDGCWCCSREVDRWTATFVGFVLALQPRRAHGGPFAASCLAALHQSGGYFKHGHTVQVLFGSLAFWLSKAHAYAHREGAENAKRQSMEATKLLKSWKELYFQTRRAIEKAGHTARWEFDVRKLFGQSEYIREVCVDLTEICDVRHQNNFGSRACE